MALTFFCYEGLSKGYNVLNEFMFQYHMRFCFTQWSATRFYGSLSVYRRPLPSAKIAPLEAQLKIACRRFLLFYEMIRKEKRPIHILPASYRLTVGGFVLVQALFKSQTLLFVSDSSFFSLSYLYSVTVFEKFLNVFSCLKQNNSEKILRNSESLIAMTHDGNCCATLLFCNALVCNALVLRFYYLFLRPSMDWRQRI